MTGRPLSDGPGTILTLDHLPPEVQPDALNSTYARKTGLVDTLVAPVYLSHRGGLLVYPEHSMEGYRASMAAGAGLEMDVQALSDGTLILCHDATVDRTMTGAGNVSSFTKAQWLDMRLKAARAGGSYAVPPMFADVLDEFGGRALITPELKASAARTAFIAAITRRSLERSVIAHSVVYADAQAIAAAGICTAYQSDLIGTGGSNPTFAAVRASGIEFVSCATTVATQYLTDAVAAGLKPLLYTPNTKAAAATEIARGAFGVFTDDPWHVTGRFPRQNFEPRDALPYPGMGRGSNSDASNVYFIGRQLRQANTSLFVSVPLSWAGTRPTGNVRLYFTADYKAGSDQTKWIGVAFGAYPDEDTWYYDGAVTGQNAYHCIARRNGTMAIYKATSGGSPSNLVAQTGATAVPSGAEGTVRFMLEINSSGIIWKNLDTGTIATSSDTALRNAGRFSLTASQQAADFYDFAVEDL